MYSSFFFLFAIDLVKHILFLIIRLRLPLFQTKKKFITNFCINRPEARLHTLHAHPKPATRKSNYVFIRTWMAIYIITCRCDLFVENARRIRSLYRASQCAYITRWSDFHISYFISSFAHVLAFYVRITRKLNKRARSFSIFARFRNSIDDAVWCSCQSDFIIPFSFSWKSQLQYE